MTRDNLSLQNLRSANKPFDIGTFSELSLRYLKGNLGPKNEVILDGYGNGEYNHWYSIEITSPAWIILIKDGNNPKHFGVSCYDITRQPLKGKSIFQYDTIAVENGTGFYYPYVNTVMSSQSDIYNTFNATRLDKGDERYYPLEKGKYLICVSAVRNEPFDYGLGVVVEFPATSALFALEDNIASICTSETSLIENASRLDSPITTNVDIPISENRFTPFLAIVEDPFSVSVPEGSSWLIIDTDSTDVTPFLIELEPGDPGYFGTVHVHSETEWKEAWERDHHPDNKFPSTFLPYTIN
jgi:hypothetical protein